MAKHYVWLHPAAHPEMPRRVHLTTARLANEDPDIGVESHAFEEWEVEVPKQEVLFENGQPVFDVIDTFEDGSPRTCKPRMVPSAHPDGIGTTHGDEALCGLKRTSWVNPLVPGGDHPKCQQCLAKLPQ